MFFRVDHRVCVGLKKGFCRVPIGFSVGFLGRLGFRLQVPGHPHPEPEGPKVDVLLILFSYITPIYICVYTPDIVPRFLSSLNSP